METALIAAAVLACPVGMAVMGWFMAKGKRNPEETEHPSLDELRDEHRRLEAEIDRLDGARGDGARASAGRH
jgi:hypothetical protein